jgi:pyruvate dehydrogenase E2 component (dihydrolipoamide acetyltransferase)
MNFIFHFPDLGEGLEEGTILAWYVTEGQQVNEGDPLVQMETDKVVADIPSPKKGVIVLLHGSVGDVIKVGTPLVEIKTEDADGVQQSGQVGTTKEKVTTEPVSETEEDAGAVVGTMEIAGKDALLPESTYYGKSTAKSTGHTRGKGHGQREGYRHQQSAGQRSFGQGEK